MADLKRLGTDLARVDRLIVDLVQRRMDLARLVGFEKMRTQQPLFRAEIEDRRLDQIAEYATSIGVNKHVARAILYTLINESCKQQTILLQDRNASDLELLEGEARKQKLRSNLLLLTERVAPAYDNIFYGPEFFAQTYARYERERLLGLMSGLTDRELAVDLGCGTGHASFLLASEYKTVVGLDVSQHMQYQAALNAERLAGRKCRVFVSRRGVRAAIRGGQRFARRRQLRHCQRLLRLPHIARRDQAGAQA